MNTMNSRKIENSNKVQFILALICWSSAMLFLGCQRSNSDSIKLKVSEIEKFSTVKQEPSGNLILVLDQIRRSNQITIVGPNGTYYASIEEDDEEILLDSNSLKSKDTISVFNGFEKGTYLVGIGKSTKNSPERLSVNFSFNLKIE